MLSFSFFLSFDIFFLIVHIKQVTDVQLSEPRVFESMNTIPVRIVSHFRNTSFVLNLRFWAIGLITRLFFAKNDANVTDVREDERQDKFLKLLRENRGPYA